MRAKPFLAGIAAMGLALSSARGDPSLEYAVKAAYLPKFVPFISWPEGTFSSATAPVNICVLGPDPFAGKLDQEAGSLKAGDRPVAVRHLGEPDPQASCQLLFMGADDDPALVEGTLDAMKGRPVVTVTDSGLKARGVISFIIETNHVRFDIDDAGAAQDGLVISSKLLGLAHAVKQRGAR
jgi:YfiR/HmsC-like